MKAINDNEGAAKEITRGFKRMSEIPDALVTLTKSTNQQREGRWETNFDQFIAPVIMVALGQEVKEKLKSFIKETLATERERMLGEAAERVDKMQIRKIDYPFPNRTPIARAKRVSYNNALKEVLALITSLKNK